MSSSATVLFAGALLWLGGWFVRQGYDGWKEKILKDIIRTRGEEIGRLMDAITKHYSARGHDRCWENDAGLYRAAGLSPGEPQLPCKEEFLARCREYYEQQSDKPR